MFLGVMEGNLLPGIDFAQGSPRNKMEVDKSIDNIVSFVSQVNQSILNASIFKHIKHYKWNYTLESLKSKTSSLTSSSLSLINGSKFFTT